VRLLRNQGSTGIWGRVRRPEGPIAPKSQQPGPRTATLEQLISHWCGGLDAPVSLVLNVQGAIVSRVRKPHREGASPMSGPVEFAIFGSLESNRSYDFPARKCWYFPREVWQRPYTILARVRRDPGSQMVKRPLQTIDCSGRLTTVTLPILTRSRPRLSWIFLRSEISRRARAKFPLGVFRRHPASEVRRSPFSVAQRD
jgi:hypothetical protein